MVIDEHNGFLVPQKDVDAFADRVEQLVADSELRARMSAESLHHATTDFQWDKVM